MQLRPIYFIFRSPFKLRDALTDFDQVFEVKKIEGDDTAKAGLNAEKFAAESEANMKKEQYDNMFKSFSNCMFFS